MFSFLHSFIPSFLLIEFMHICLLNFFHSFCIALVHSCWHVGVHLLRVSLRTLMRNFVNFCFWLWEIFAILRRLLIFALLFLNHRSIVDSITTWVKSSATNKANSVQNDELDNGFLHLWTIIRHCSLFFGFEIKLIFCIAVCLRLPLEPQRLEAKRASECPSAEPW